MRDILRRYQPDRLDDLIALNASTVLARWGTTSPTSTAESRSRTIFRRLKDILEGSFGVIIYQEQATQLSNRLAGYSAEWRTWAGHGKQEEYL